MPQHKPAPLDDVLPEGMDASLPLERPGSPPACPSECGSLRSYHPTASLRSSVANSSFNSSIGMSSIASRASRLSTTGHSILDGAAAAITAAVAAGNGNGSEPLSSLELPRGSFRPKPEGPDREEPSADDATAADGDSAGLNGSLNSSGGRGRGARRGRSEAGSASCGGSGRGTPRASPGPGMHRRTAPGAGPQDGEGEPEKEWLDEEGAISAAVQAALAPLLPPSPVAFSRPGSAQGAQGSAGKATQAEEGAAALTSPEASDGATSDGSSGKAPPTPERAEGGPATAGTASATASPEPGSRAVSAAEGSAAAAGATASQAQAPPPEAAALAPSGQLLQPQPQPPPMPPHPPGGAGPAQARRPQPGAGKRGSGRSTPTCATPGSDATAEGVAGGCSPLPSGMTTPTRALPDAEFYGESVVVAAAAAATALAAATQRPPPSPTARPAAAPTAAAPLLASTQPASTAVPPPPRKPPSPARPERPLPPWMPPGGDSARASASSRAIAGASNSSHSTAHAATASGTHPDAASPWPRLKLRTGMAATASAAGATVDSRDSSPSTTPTLAARRQAKGARPASFGLPSLHIDPIAQDLGNIRSLSGQGHDDGAAGQGRGGSRAVSIPGASPGRGRGTRAGRGSAHLSPLRVVPHTHGQQHQAAGSPGGSPLPLSPVTADSPPGPVLLQAESPKALRSSGRPAVRGNGGGNAMLPRLSVVGTSLLRSSGSCSNLLAASGRSTGGISDPRVAPGDLVGTCVASLLADTDSEECASAKSRGAVTPPPPPPPSRERGLRAGVQHQSGIASQSLMAAAGAGAPPRRMAPLKATPLPPKPPPRPMVSATNAASAHGGGGGGGASAAGPPAAGSRARTLADLAGAGPHGAANASALANLALAHAQESMALAESSAALLAAALGAAAGTPAHAELQQQLQAGMHAPGSPLAALAAALQQHQQQQQQPVGDLMPGGGSSGGAPSWSRRSMAADRGQIQGRASWSGSISALALGMPGYSANADPTASGAGAWPVRQADPHAMSSRVSDSGRNPLQASLSWQLGSLLAEQQAAAAAAAVTSGQQAPPGAAPPLAGAGQPLQAWGSLSVSEQQPQLQPSADLWSAAPELRTSDSGSGPSAVAAAVAAAAEMDMSDVAAAAMSVLAGGHGHHQLQGGQMDLLAGIDWAALGLLGDPRVSGCDTLSGNDEEIPEALLRAHGALMQQLQAQGVDTEAVMAAAAALAAPGRAPSPPRAGSTGLRPSPHLQPLDASSSLFGLPGSGTAAGSRVLRHRPYSENGMVDAGGSSGSAAGPPLLPVIHGGRTVSYSGTATALSPGAHHQLQEGAGGGYMSGSAGFSLSSPGVGPTRQDLLSSSLVFSSSAAPAQESPLGAVGCGGSGSPLLPTLSARSSMSGAGSPAVPAPGRSRIAPGSGNGR